MSSTAVQIRNFSSTILEDGGEGVMLRAPNTVYQRGLSVNLLKLKVTTFLLLGLFIFIFSSFLQHLLSLTIIR